MRPLVITLTFAIVSTSLPPARSTAQAPAGEETPESETESAPEAEETGETKAENLETDSKEEGTEAASDGIEGPESGAFTPGKGFRVGLNDFGELRISLYMVVRYLNQLPPDESFVDHLGRVHPVDTRNDIQLHREMIYFSGWIYSKRLRYQGMVWTVNATTQVAVAGSLGYVFGEAFALYGGIGSLPGTRSVTYVFPYFFGTDRQMADEFFRPSFTGGIWAIGEPVRGLKYHAMLGNNLSGLGITAAQLTRKMATSASVWVMPTTGEFGPRGAFGDFEEHKKLATRFGAAYTRSDENRFSQPAVTSPDNTQIRLSDSLIIFETGALAPDVTVNDVLYQLASFDAGVKYKGFALHFEFYNRWLTKLRADGPLPLESLLDQGFYVQTGYYVLPKLLEFFGSTSWIFGEFNDSRDYALGVNVYPARTRNWRINGIAIYVDRSAMGNLFGYYVGGQTGPTFSIATDIFF